jgi:transcriptional regulator with XRE-family HTH domain
MVEDDARLELTNFLKTRRARLSPADFGLPSAARRRTIGLRREDVAALAGVGLTWYTAFEQGKDIRVSTYFLENLARALRFTAAERSHLFALAQRRLPPLRQPGSRRGTNQQLQPILDAIVCPAYARNSLFDVIAWNAANTRIFGDFNAIAPEERNVIWLMFARSYHRRNMPDWEMDARSLVAKFRMNFGQATNPENFSALISKLKIVSAHFERIWAQHDVSDLGEGATRFLSPRYGELRFQHYTTAPEFLPDLRIIIYVPEA